MHPVFPLSQMPRPASSGSSTGCMPPVGVRPESAKNERIHTSDCRQLGSPYASAGAKMRHRMQGTANPTPTINRVRQRSVRARNVATSRPSAPGDIQSAAPRNAVPLIVFPSTNRARPSATSATPHASPSPETPSQMSAGESGSMRATASISYGPVPGITRTTRSVPHPTNESATRLSSLTERIVMARSYDANAWTMPSTSA